VEAKKAGQSHRSSFFYYPEQLAVQRASEQMPKNTQLARQRAVPKVSKHVSSRKHILTGGTAVDLATLLREWDNGKREVRVQILRAMVASHQEKTGAELEMEYGNGASLFLTRISAWLRLTYLLGVEVALQLQAIHIFLSAASGHRFLTEFIEVGGVLTVLEILNLRQLFDEDVVDALRILHTVASTGRSYKELLCEMQGIDAVLHCLNRSQSELQCEGCRLLLITLGRGNPTYSPLLTQSLLGGLAAANNPKAQRIAAQTLRTLLEERATGVNIDMSWAAPVLGLLRTRDLQTQYEGFELAKLYHRVAGQANDTGLESRTMESVLTGGLAFLLRQAIPEHSQAEEAHAVPEAEGPGRFIPADMKEIQEQIHREFLSDESDEEGGSVSAFEDSADHERGVEDTWRPMAESALAPLHCQQLGVARLVGMLAGTGPTSNEFGQSFVRKFGGLGSLLHCLGSVASAEAKKQTALSCKALLVQFPDCEVAVVDSIGGEQCERLMTNAAAFAEAVSESAALGKTLVAATRADSQHSRLAPEEGLAVADLWTAMPMPTPTVSLLSSGATEG
jgi:hypothetical protein